jgi:hypothetical protein
MWIYFTADRKGSQVDGLTDGSMCTNVPYALGGFVGTRLNSQQAFGNRDAKLVGEFTGQIEDQSENFVQAIAWKRACMPIGSPGLTTFPHPMRLKMNDDKVIMGHRVDDAIDEQSRRVRLCIGHWEGNVYTWAIVNVSEDGHISAQVHVNPPDLDRVA